MSYSDLELGQVGPMGRPIKDIIMQAQTFIVYIDDEDEIQWATEGYENFHENFGEIQNRVSEWETKVNKLFNKTEAHDLKCLLAEAYARILDNKNIDLARNIIDSAVDTIQKQGREILKQYYAIASFFTALAICLVIFLSKFNKKVIESLYGLDEYCVWMTMLFGGIGAFIFTIIRLKSYQPDIVISKTVHMLDGILRIFYGVIFGLIIAVAIKSNILLGFLDQVQKNIYMSVFMGICAGASEMLIPNLIKQIEVKSQG